MAPLAEREEKVTKNADVKGPTSKETLIQLSAPANSERRQQRSRPLAVRETVQPLRLPADLSAAASVAAP